MRVLVRCDVQLVLDSTRKSIEMHLMHFVKYPLQTDAVILILLNLILKLKNYLANSPFVALRRPEKKDQVGEKMA